MKISIIVPVYNVEKYIRKCLLSLLQQDNDDYEIIIVLDGSTDRSENIIAETIKANRNKAVKVIMQENKGPGAARNQGLRYASGEYIAFVDSDDYVSSDYLSKIISKLSYSECDILLFNAIVTDDYGIVKKKFRMHDGKDENTSVREKPELLMYPPAVWNKIYRKSFWDSVQVSYPEEIIYEDTTITRVLMERAGKIWLWDECLYYYVQRKNSITNTNQTRRMADMLNVNRQLVEMFNNAGVYSAYKEELEFIALSTMLLEGLEKMMASGEEKKKKEDFLNFMKRHYPECEKNRYLSESDKERVKLMMSGDFDEYYQKYGKIKKWRMKIRECLPMWMVVLLTNYREEYHEGKNKAE